MREGEPFGVHLDTPNSSNANNVRNVNSDGTLNNKTNIYPLRNGVDFLGFHTYLTETGAVIRKVRRRSKNNMKRKLKKMRGLVERGKITTATVEQSYKSWRGHAEKGNCYHLIRRTDHYYNRLFNSKEAEKCQKQ